MMETKIPWNLRVFESVARGFDGLVQREIRGDKGTAASAACLLFLMTPEEVRQELIDVVKLAEGRGRAGTVLEAAHKLWFKKGAKNERTALDIMLRLLNEIKAKRDACELKPIFAPQNETAAHEELEAEARDGLDSRRATSKARREAS